MDRPPQPCASADCNFSDRFIECSGSCQQRFHAVCAGLSKAAVAAIDSSTNWFWFCDVCCQHTWLEWITGAPLVSAGDKSCRSSNCIFTDQRVTCDGPCGKDFHAMCAKLSRTDLLVIGSSSNILWVCDGCKGKVPPGRDDFDEELPELEDEHVVEDDSMVVKLENKFESIITKLNRLNENLENGVYTPPDSSPNSEGNSDSESSREMDDQPAEPAAVDGAVTITEVTEGVVDLPKNDHESLDSSAMNDKLPAVESPKKEPINIFTFGIVKPEKKPNFSFSLPTDSVELFKKSLAEQKPKPPKLTPVKPEKLEADNNNNNVPNPVKPPQEIVLKVFVPVKKDNSKFALWIKFDDPDLTSRDVRSMIRQALGMSATDSIEAKNVVPSHIRFTGQALYASFKVDLDARWRKKALDGASWRSVPFYREHSEWVNR